MTVRWAKDRFFGELRPGQKQHSSSQHAKTDRVMCVKESDRQTGNKRRDRRRELERGDNIIPEGGGDDTLINTVNLLIHIYQLTSESIHDIDGGDGD